MAFVDMDRIKKSVATVLRQHGVAPVTSESTLDYIRTHQPPTVQRKLSRAEQDDMAVLRRIRDALHGDKAA